ncbi:MAG: peptide ABC transporter substrate-binding protein [Phycisphaerales bacterium]
MARLAVPFLLLLGVIAVAVLSDRPQATADLTFINRGDVTTLDLQRMSWVQDFRAANALFEGLVRRDVFSPGYDPIPGVAERWEVSDDAREYVFHLRADARWSNGDAVTAGDFVYSWRRALLPETACDYTGQFQLIEGGAEFFAWRADALKGFAARRARAASTPGGTFDGPGEARALWRETEAKFAELVRLRAPDERTLIVKLRLPTPYFLDLCAMPVFHPVYPPLVKGHETLDPDSGRMECGHGWTKPPLLVSNGPMVLTVWRFKRDMRLEKSPHYWNRDALGVDSIAMPSVTDGNAAVLAFKTGAADWVSDVTPSYKGDMWADKLRFYAEHRAELDSLRAQGLDQFEIDRRLSDDPRKNIHAIPTFGTFFWNFNCRPRLPDGRVNPFHDARVRRAFAMVVDKRAIVDNVKRCGEPVARTLTPPGSIGDYREPRGIDCVSDFADADARRAWIERARGLLRDAGYPDPKQFPTVELLFNKDSGHDLVAQTLARNWEEHLGVPVTLAQKEIKVFKDDLVNGNYVTGRGGWYGDYGDPTTFLDLSRTGDGNNDRKYSSAAYDGLMDRAAAETDPGARLAILTEAERLIMEEDLPVIPLYHYVTLYLFDADEFTGLNPHPRADQMLHLIDVFGDGKGDDVPKVVRSGKR